MRAARPETAEIKKDWPVKGQLSSCAPIHRRSCDELLNSKKADKSACRMNPAPQFVQAIVARTLSSASGDPALELGVEFQLALAVELGRHSAVHQVHADLLMGALQSDVVQHGSVRPV